MEHIFLNKTEWIQAWFSG